MAQHYHALIASLPHLPHPLRAPGLPIGPARLRERLAWLSPADAARLARLVAALAWTLPPARWPDDAWLDAWQDALRQEPDPALRAVGHFHLEWRLLIAALRRRRSGLPLAIDAATELPYAQQLRHHGQAPQFGLQHRHPWLVLAEHLLARGDGIRLEQLLIERAWRALEHLDQPPGSGFRAVAAYRLRWELLTAWPRPEPDGGRVGAWLDQGAWEYVGP
ncbi:MAG: hypothetical protein H5U26_06740 [Immundisolibacter sp.]|uniref:hypothetical protein n=1 Tax=Immundisolibacter sp. TaxID=1934948 RepID=UPI00199B0CF8|nr:hypothetical protein [Immundisolibacter sp.]MBC7161786.1 hypothetical protein [Immundisolibacter sp.]